ncbi:helicase associated domain-containing protein [Coraliomargarita sp. SDUM461004]|uniref:Helicase associated domain-containing protein n=1 Tax=Thalassobacterium sedimentorum TaxID=3041258 RepID=A0ABU1AN53_9BACT|nr:helicase associated domain-containing protein [Coraliomargarita sp. SDUM461004]MDQ8196231.1 helicase associated domain-containing protein [Coraliomargarita sp. SDUM461004]
MRWFQSLYQSAQSLSQIHPPRPIRNRLNHKDNLQTLIERSARILQQVRTYQEGKTRRSGRRGRKTQWRPHCETTEQQEAQKNGPAPISSKGQAKRRFNRMLRKFNNFKETTGETTLPHGYTGDINLRTWANQQRGLFKSGRLAQWKVDLLKPSGVLDPPTTGISYLSADGQHKISDTWLERYEALKTFHKAHGHSRITRRDEQNKTLANWVWQQRAKRRKSQLLPKQIELLDEIEFCWNLRSRI